MLRVALITYLTLATLAGPAWCCCTLSRLATQTLRLVGATDGTAPRACCQHHSAHTETNKPPEGQRENHCPLPKDHRCPCQQQPSGQQVALPLDAQSAAQSWLLSLGLVLVNFVAIQLPLVPDNAELPNHFSLGSDCRHLTGSEILRLFQVFRC